MRAWEYGICIGREIAVADAVDVDCIDTGL